MNKCFKDYISIKGTTPVIVSKSGKYINDLPGVETAQIAALTKDEQVDFIDTWNSIYTRSVDNFITDVSNELHSLFFTEKTIDSNVTGLFGDEFEVNDYSGLSGVQIELANSRHSITNIVSIRIYSTTAKAINIYVYNKEGGILLDTLEENVEAGYNVIYVNKQYDQPRLFIAYDATATESYKTTTAYASYSVSARNYPHSRYYTIVNGGGLTVEYNTYCSIEKFICSRLSMFTNALLNKIGVELMIERLTSSRVNCFTLEPEEARNLMRVYEDDYNEALKAALNNIKIHDDNYCFSCKGPIKRTIVLP